MDDLAVRVSASLENPNTDPWFPELTDDLATRAWEILYRNIGLTPDCYGTERVLSLSISTPREIITSLKTCPSARATAQAISIEVLTQECSVQYEEQGVNFYSSDEILHTSVLSCLQGALAIINQVPSLMRTVAALVRSLHVIKPKDEDHDVSFSEPYVPFSIFVSVPKERTTNDTLRIAEAIVHEAMHLQLTLIERIQPLVSRTDGEYFSPWRRDYRNAQGLVHGLYVFLVISQFLGRLDLSDHSNTEYVSGRCSEIAAETNQILAFSACSELTPIGSRFVCRLLHPAFMNFA